MDASAVKRYLNELQDRITAAVGTSIHVKFRRDPWARPEGGGGESRILSDGAVFERAGVSFSHVFGDKMPPSASNQRPEIAGAPFEAMGLSLVFHPRNPHRAHDALQCPLPRRAPRARARKCGGSAAASTSRPTIHTTRTCCTGIAPRASACQPFGPDIYEKYKAWCDRYFFLPHRNETRGVGGLFFDDLNEGGFERCFAFLRSVGDHFLPAYMPILERRKDQPYGDRERQFQLYRRGRYVEFNLVYDRGTLFGLQSRGRTESILMSMPPLVRWEYDWHPEPGSPEARLYEDFLRPRDYLTELGGTYVIERPPSTAEPRSISRSVGWRR